MQLLQASPWRYILAYLVSLSLVETVALQLQPPPEFFDHRIKMFDQLKAEYDEFAKGE